jgi:hypothetical protein
LLRIHHVLFHQKLYEIELHSLLHAYVLTQLIQELVGKAFVIHLLGFLWGWRVGCAR